MNDLVNQIRQMTAYQPKLPDQVVNELKEMVLTLQSERSNDLSTQYPSINPDEQDIEIVSDVPTMKEAKYIASLIELDHGSSRIIKLGATFTVVGLIPLTVAGTTASG